MSSFWRLRSEVRSRNWLCSTLGGRRHCGENVSQILLAEGRRGLATHRLSHNSSSRLPRCSLACLSGSSPQKKNTTPPLNQRGKKQQLNNQLFSHRPRAAVPVIRRWKMLIKRRSRPRRSGPRRHPSCCAVPLKAAIIGRLTSSRCCRQDAARARSGSRSTWPLAIPEGDGDLADLARLWWGGRRCGGGGGGAYKSHCSLGFTRQLLATGTESPRSLLPLSGRITWPELQLYPI